MQNDDVQGQVAPNNVTQDDDCQGEVEVEQEIEARAEGTVEETAPSPEEDEEPIPPVYDNLLNVVDTPPLPPLPEEQLAATQPVAETAALYGALGGLPSFEDVLAFRFGLLRPQQLPPQFVAPDDFTLRQAADILAM